MSPAAGEPSSFRSPTSGNTSGRLLGLRESNQALAELKTKLEFALSRLNDQDTQRTGVEEIREFLQTLYPDWFPMVISCIAEAGANLKPLGRCESVKLLGLLAELHGEAVVPLLPRILQVVVTRLQDADLHLREACAETVFRLARSLVEDAEGSPVFATLLKPLFGALGEHNKWVQIGAAACICSVIQGSPPPVIRENLGRLCSRLVQHLSLALAMAKPQLLSACIYAMQAVEGADFDEVLPGLMPCLEMCLQASSDWQTRKQAIEVLQVIGDNPELGQSLELPLPSNASVRPTHLQRRIAVSLEVVKADKVRAVREAVKDCLLRWSITKSSGLIGSVTMPRSASPTPGVAEQREQANRSQAPLERPLSGVVRTTSPGPASGSGPCLQVMVASPDGPALTSAGARGQSRGARSAPRERGDTCVDDASISASARVDSVAFANAQLRVGEADEDDAAVRKAARDSAVRAALLGADLSSTKKPRPKRERVSIFNGPTNSKFFNKTPSLTRPGDEISEVVLEEQHPASPCANSEEAPYVCEVDEEPVLESNAASTWSGGLVGIGSAKTTRLGAGIRRQPPQETIPAGRGEQAGENTEGQTSSARPSSRAGAGTGPQFSHVAMPSGHSEQVGENMEGQSSSAQPSFRTSGHGQLWPDIVASDLEVEEHSHPGGTLSRKDQDSSSSRSGDRSGPSASTRAAQQPISPRLDQKTEAVPAPTSQSREGPLAPHDGPEVALARCDDGMQGPTVCKHSQARPAELHVAVDASSDTGEPAEALRSGQEDHGALTAEPAALQATTSGPRGVVARREQQRLPADSAPAPKAPESGFSRNPKGAQAFGEEVSATPASDHAASSRPKESASGSARAAADWPWDSEPVGGSSVRRGATEEDMELLITQLETLSERLHFIEEEKQRVEVQLTGRLDKMAQTCESQSETLGMQQEKLEMQERRLQMQEQQLKLQDQKLQRHEKLGQQHAQQVKDLHVRLQQQEQQFEQQFEQQDQQLQEHEQQLEQQEQLLEEHKAVLEELVATGQVDPDEEPLSDDEPIQRRGSSNSRGGAGPSREVSEAWGDEYQAQLGRSTPAPLPLMVPNMEMAPGTGGLAGSGGGLAGSSGDRPTIALSSGLLQMSLEARGVKGGSPKKTGQLWEKVVELCGEQRFLEAYKQAIAEPEESCLLRLMRHTGPIVERLDAESNSRLIRRLIHILSSPSKDCAAASIEQIFAWLRQALTSGIHFTASQVEDLAAALQRVASPQSPLPVAARGEAAQLQVRVTALRRS